MEDQIFYGILAPCNVGDADERRFEPLAKQPSAHGRIGLVEDVEEGSPSAAVADVLGDFQMTQTGSVDDQSPFIVDVSNELICEMSDCMTSLT